MKSVFAGSALVLSIWIVAHAGGPPPMYVIVEKVVLEPNENEPDRIQIWGSFIRMKKKHGDFGAPEYGFIYLSIDKSSAKTCREEWAKWKKLAGSEKVAVLGSCCEAGKFMGYPIHKPEEKVDHPDATYDTGVLRNDEASKYRKEVQDLIAFHAKLKAEAIKNAKETEKRSDAGK